MPRHPQAADGEGLSLAVTILPGQGERLAEQALRAGELPGAERGLRQYLLGRRAELAGSPPRLDGHGRQRIPVPPNAGTSANQTPQQVVPIRHRSACL
jgi:hypothetical protein